MSVLFGKDVRNDVAQDARLTAWWRIVRGWPVMSDVI